MILTASDSLMNLFLRIITMVARFFLIFFLAKILSPQEFGFYGLVAATVAYSLYFVGLDFYVYSTRELSKSDKKKSGLIIKSQIILSSYLYLLVLPVIAILLLNLDWSLYIVFYSLILIFFEHVNQEIMRILIAIGKPLQASVVSLFRHGIWVFALFFLNFFAMWHITLSSVIQFWIMGGFLASILGMRFIYHLGYSGWRDFVNWKWIRNGIKVSAIFLVATIFLRGLFTFDRYLVEYFIGLDAVAAYVLFIGIANALALFLDAGVFSLALAPILKLSQDHDFSRAHELIKKVFIYSLIGVFIYGLSSYFLMSYFLGWLNKDIYYEYESIYPLIFIAISFSILSTPSHLGLYSRNRDQSIVFSHISAFISFSIITFWVSSFSVFYAVPVGLAVANIVLFLIKSSSYIMMINSNFKRIA